MGREGREGDGEGVLHIAGVSLVRAPEGELWADVRTFPSARDNLQDLGSIVRVRGGESGSWGSTCWALPGIPYTLPAVSTVVRCQGACWVQ